MKKIKVLIAALFLVATLAGLQNCGKGSSYNTMVSTCVAPSSWFPHSQTPPPEEGVNSPFNDPDSTTNCDFHLWSWQKFLYLTRTDPNGRAKFENLVQVSNQMQPLGSTLVLTDISQAGTGTILMDKMNQPIYYAIYMDSTMYNFSKQYVQLFTNNCDSAGQLSGSLMKEFGYDTLTYPVGSFELKTAWILTSSLGGDSTNFYLTTAMLNNVATRVALVGMHIVGRVVNHPELIWATYTHLKAAPTAHWPVNLSQDSIPDPTQILDTSNYLFYNAGLPLDSCSITKNSGVAGSFKSIYHLFENGTQPLYSGITTAARAQDSTNLANIKSINASVLAQLTPEPGPWKNYAYFGSIWIDPTTATLVPGDGSIGSLSRANLRGSRALSNIAAETYIQYKYFKNPTPMPINSFNCFGCHGTIDDNFSSGNGRNFILALSHMFDNALGDTLGGTIEQVRIMNR